MQLYEEKHQNTVQWCTVGWTARQDSTKESSEEPSAEQGQWFLTKHVSMRFVLTLCPNLQRTWAKVQWYCSQHGTEMHWSMLSKVKKLCQLHSNYTSFTHLPCNYYKIVIMRNAYHAECRYVQVSSWKNHLIALQSVTISFSNGTTTITRFKCVLLSVAADFEPGKFLPWRMGGGAGQRLDEADEDARLLQFTFTFLKLDLEI